MDGQLAQSGGSEAELWRSLREEGSAPARDALIARFLPLARSQALRHKATGVPLEDLVQAANLGLIAAVDRFDPQREVAFTTFAVPVIRGELKRELSRTGWAVRTPRQLQELMHRVRRAKEALTGRLGRLPTATELAAESDLSAEDVHEASNVELALLSQTQYLGRRESGRRREDVEQGVDDGFESIDEASTIARALAALSPRERRVLHLSFLEERAKDEIAAEIDVSERQVSRIIRGAVEKMQRVARATATPG